MKDCPERNTMVNYDPFRVNHEKFIKKACINCEHYDRAYRLCRVQPPFQEVTLSDFCDLHFTPSEKAIDAAKEKLEKLIGTVMVSDGLGIERR